MDRSKEIMDGLISREGMDLRWAPVRAFKNSKRNIFGRIEVLPGSVMVFVSCFSFSGVLTGRLPWLHGEASWMGDMRCQRFGA